VTISVIYEHACALARALVDAAAVLSVKASRQYGFGLGDYLLDDYRRRLDSADHVDRLSGIDDCGIEITGRSRCGVIRPLGIDPCLQRLLTAVPFSPERVGEGAARIVARPIDPARAIEHCRAKRVVAAAADDTRFGCWMHQ
jgi:hypothetical protein